VLPLDWLKLPLYRNGILYLPGLDVEEFFEGDIREICQRIMLVHDAYENRLCEGRLIDPEIFNELDGLGDRLDTVTLDELKPLIRKLGERYGLYEAKVIDVTHPLA
jgi:hypothetical protein